MVEDELEPGPVEGKRLPVKLIIIVAALLLMLLSGIIVWKMVSDEPEPETPGQTEANQEITENFESAYGDLIFLDSFLVHLANTKMRRYINAEMVLELFDKSDINEIENQLPEIRELIKKILEDKYFSDIRTIDGKIALKNEIIRIINSNLEKAKIRNIYYSNFVIHKYKP